MSERKNLKRTVVMWTTVAAAGAAYLLTPDSWAPFVGIGILLAGWFVWESMPRTLGGEPSGAAESQEPAKGSWAEALGMISGGLFFGLLAGLVLPGVGETWRLSAATVHGLGTAMGIAFAAWTWRSHSRRGAIVAFIAFMAPTAFLTHIILSR